MWRYVEWSVVYLREKVIRARMSCHAGRRWDTAEADIRLILFIGSPHFRRVLDPNVKPQANWHRRLSS